MLMTVTNTRHSYNGWAFVFLLFALYGIVSSIMFILPFSEYEISEIPLLILLFVFLNLPPLFFIDIFLWHFFGKEIISITETELILKKAGRLFRRKRTIKIQQIRDIYFWQKKIKDIHLQFAFWDMAFQGRLCINLSSV